jgi:thiamine pyrophosphokinase
MEIGTQSWPLDRLVEASTDEVTASFGLIAIGACILINAPLVSHQVLVNILSQSPLRICADGGSNVMYDTISSGSCPECERMLPHIVIGDLDSIRDDVREFFSSRGVEIMKVWDQDRTDLEKALTYAETRLSGHSPFFVPIIGSIGAHEGRIDQFFAVLHAMFKFRNSAVIRPIQVGNQSILIVLENGKHDIRVPESAVGRHCGLVPMFGKVYRIKTTGLEWNLNDEMGASYFGGLVSTNNILRSNLLYVETSDPILFTFTYR